MCAVESHICWVAQHSDNVRVWPGRSFRVELCASRVRVEMRGDALEGFDVNSFSLFVSFFF